MDAVAPAAQWPGEPAPGLVAVVPGALDTGADAQAVGWRAELELGFAPRAGRTRLAHKRQLGPLTVQRAFHPEGETCHLYLLHPPGGIVGGDSISIAAGAAAGAHGLITTPGAAKLYRSAGPTAVVEQRLQVAAGGALEWFPLETIAFPGARVKSRTRVELAGDARFIGWEVLSLGRPVIGERFEQGVLDTALWLDRDGRPLLRERLRVDHPSQLDGPSGLRGRPVTGSFVATGCDDTALAAARAAVDGADGDLLLGITRVDDLLIARCLAGTTEPLQRVFCTLWRALRPALMGREACPPRVWAT